MESYWEDILTVFLREQDREVRQFALGHTANELQRQDLFFLTLKRVFWSLLNDLYSTRTLFLTLSVFAHML